MTKAPHVKVKGPRRTATAIIDQFHIAFLTSKTGLPSTGEAFEPSTRKTGFIMGCTPCPCRKLKREHIGGVVHPAWAPNALGPLSEQHAGSAGPCVATGAPPNNFRASRRFYSPSAHLTFL